MSSEKIKSLKRKLEKAKKKLKNVSRSVSRRSSIPMQRPIPRRVQKPVVPDQELHEILSYNPTHAYLNIDALKKKASMRMLLFSNNSLMTPIKALPKTLSLSKYTDIVFDQGQLGSCTANALSLCYRMLTKVSGTPYTPSRLAIYYYERLLEGSVNYDAGADPVDGMSYIKQNGIQSESTWPYIISKFTMLPTTNLIEQQNHKISSYSVIPIDSNALSMIKTYINNNIPIVFCFVVYASFESDAVTKTGLVPMPPSKVLPRGVKKDTILGGHATTIIGYDDTKSLFTVQNSWGTSWGLKGNFLIPYAYITNPRLCIELSIINI